jgi:5-methylcytosine-specific restriction enzyme A
MPKKRMPKDIWFKKTRPLIWKRDGHKCTRCGKNVTLEECHIDHIVSGKFGTNHHDNLRTLCRRCHVLRADFRHQGMISKALKDGIIPPNWREHVWEDLD